MTDETPEQAPSTWPSTPAPSGDPLPPPGAPAGPVAGPSYPAASGMPPATAPGYPVAPVATPPVGTSTNAIVALVLAVLSWAVCPLIPAIVALVFASMGAKEIAASGGRVDGRGLITAARIVSWINIGVFVAVIVALAFVALIAALA